MSVGSISLSCTRWRYQCTKFSLASRCVAAFMNHNCLSTVDASAVMLHFMVTQICQFAVQVEPRTFVDTSPIQNQLRLVFFSGRVFCVLSSCLKWTLLLEAFTRICKSLSCLNKRRRKRPSEFTTILVWSTLINLHYSSSGIATATDSARWEARSQRSCMRKCSRQKVTNDICQINIRILYTLAAILSIKIHTSIG
jgi:hypothetical protein